MDVLNVTILNPEYFIWHGHEDGQYFTFIETNKTLTKEVPIQHGSQLEAMISRGISEALNKGGTATIILTLGA